MPPASDTTVASLTAVMGTLDLEAHQLQLFDPAYPRFDAQRPLLVLAPQFEAVRTHLLERYPADLEARAAIAGGASSTSIGSLPSEAVAWLLPALTPEQDVRGLAGIRGVVERLFSPDGCPWDQAQTPETLATYFIEEAYELVDAIEGGDPGEIREELGDVLAHVFMQTAVAQQAGQFTVEDVVEYISRKLVRRHPHVYGDVDSDDPEEIERIWEQIKAAERAERAARNPDAATRPESALDSVPNSAPSLVRSDQLIGRAERAVRVARVSRGPTADSPRGQRRCTDGRGDRRAVVGGRPPRARRGGGRRTGATRHRERVHRALPNGRGPCSCCRCCAGAVARGRAPTTLVDRAVTGRRGGRVKPRQGTVRSTAPRVTLPPSGTIPDI
jgi:NTP pyrophosphatase (non-canonical NTP hydrolase)